MKASRPTGTTVLVALISSERYASSVEIVQISRGRGIPCEIYLPPDRYGKQIRYAARRGIPLIWFPGEQGDTPGELKDLRSAIQVPADPNQWPPGENLNFEIRIDETAWQETIRKPAYGGDKHG